MIKASKKYFVQLKIKMGFDGVYTKDLAGANLTVDAPSEANARKQVRDYLKQTYPIPTHAIQYVSEIN